MSERTDREFLSDIHEAIQRITAYVVDVEYESFVRDTKTQDAVILLVPNCPRLPGSFPIWTKKA
jgi:uncharacterized protein with HEPN domain